MIDLLNQQTMKTIFATYLISLIAIFVNAQGGNLKFESTIHDFGIIGQNAPDLVEHSFPFVNQGNGAVTIKKVVFTGAIQVDYPKSPIHPNEKGAITIKYDLSTEKHIASNSKSYEHSFTKTITLLSNSKQPLTRLNIKGKVKTTPPQEQKMVEKSGFTWYKICQNGKFGAKDMNGNKIIPEVYQDISYYCPDEKSFPKGFKVYDNNNCEGFHSLTGKCIIPVSRGYSHINKYTSKEFGTYYVFEKKGFVGFCDINGKEVITIPFSAQSIPDFQSILLTPNYVKGKFYIDYFIFVYTYNSKGAVIGGIIDGNGNFIVKGVSGAVELDEETLSFVYTKDGKNIPCGKKLSDIKSTKNPLANNPEE